MIPLPRALACMGAVWLCVAVPALAQSPEISQSRSGQNVFLFGGPMTSGYFSDAIQPWAWQLESNAFVGVGYQRFFYEYESFQLGLEAGLGVRIGSPVSGEAWAGVVGRLTEFEFGPINITPSVTGGISVVTDTIGVETTRAAASGQSATLLYYLAPEIAVSHDEHPEWEAFGRIQHRSGGFGTIAHIDGSNALTIGLRYKF
ncbi:hypothetical protein [Devosia sp. CAU 1758]